MTKIHGSRDCGNSPKNKFVQAIAIALETGNAEIEHFDADVVWEQATAKQVVGRCALIAGLAAKEAPIVLIIEHAISHGKVGAVSGEVTLADGERRRFTHVLDFTNAKANCVSMIKSYA